MKLWYTPTSPYVRKVVVSAIETGLDSRIERIATDTKLPDSALADDNPLGKVPALITDDGGALHDSPVICEYLDSLHDGPKLFPPSGGKRWTALRRQALGDGLLDAATARVREFRRPEEFRFADWLDKQKGKVDRALDALEGEAADLGGGFDIGRIALGCALGYLDLRFPDDGWRATRSGLSNWFEAISRRPSMSETNPLKPAW